MLFRVLDSTRLKYKCLSKDVGCTAHFSTLLLYKDNFCDAGVTGMLLIKDFTLLDVVEGYAPQSRERKLAKQKLKAITT